MGVLQLEGEAVATLLITYEWSDWCAWVLPVTVPLPECHEAN